MPKTPKVEFESDVTQILCIFQEQNEIGAASFDKSTGSFGILNQLTDVRPTFKLVQCLIGQLEPGVVVVSRRADMKLMKVVVEAMVPDADDTVTSEFSTTTTTRMDQSSSNIAGGDVCTSRTITTNITATSVTPGEVVQRSSSQESAVSPTEPMNRKRPVPDAFVQKFNGYASILSIPHNEAFVVEEAKNVILRIMDRDLSVEATTTARIASLAGKINFEETVTLRALAGLLKFLEDQNVNIAPSCIKAGGVKFKTIVIDDTLHINNHSRKALSIFKTNIKTSVALKSASKSEGFSLFQMIVSQCPSSIGKKTMREVMNKPLRCPEDINFRLDCIEFFKDGPVEVLIDLISKESSHIINVDSILTRMRLSTPTPHDWSTFKRSLHSAVNIAVAISEAQNMFPKTFQKELAKINIGGLAKLDKILTDIIDFEATRASEIFTVREGVDAELDAQRRNADSIGQWCEAARVNEQEYWNLRGIQLSDIGIAFWPGVGFIMELPVSEPDFLNKLAFISQNGDCKLTKSTPASMFYRTEVTEHLDKEFADPQSFINDRQVEIQMKVQEMVTEIAEDIQELIKLCADIQW